MRVEKRRRKKVSSSMLLARFAKENEKGPSERTGAQSNIHEFIKMIFIE